MRELLEFAEDMNACASDGLDALRAGNLDVVRQCLRGIQDAAGAVITEVEDREGVRLS